jgi:hypothetical protein
MKIVLLDPEIRKIIAEHVGQNIQKTISGDSICFLVREHGIWITESIIKIEIELPNN